MLQTVVLIQKIFSKVAYFLGPVCVVFAIGLIFLVSFVYFTAILPYYMYDGVYSIISLFHLSWSLWAAFNILFNYFYCISTSPGYTKDYYNVLFLFFLFLFIFIYFYLFLLLDIFLFKFYFITFRNLNWRIKF